MDSTDSINISKKSCLLGAHFSIAKGLHNALYTAKDYGCTAIQIFTKNANAWKERTVSSDEINRFKKAQAETGIREIASHTSYLINLATPEKEKHAMACSALKQELIRSSMLGIPYVVLHPGSHMGCGQKKGVLQIAESINAIFSDTPESDVRLLLETTAGQGSSVGHTFEQLSSIIDKVENKKRIGVCLDTCHIFAAGYNISTKSSYRKTINMFDSTTGIKHLYFIHLNDTKKIMGSRVDRHEHIGQGFIGIKAFGYIMNDKRFKDIPKIIETPKENDGKDWDKINLGTLLALIKK